MNFSEEFYSHIIENTTKENLFPDIIENIDDKDSLETLVRAGKSIKKFLGPPQILSCMEMERGISLYSVDKISKLAIYGGPGGILMENALSGNSLCFNDKFSLIGGLGLYGLFYGREKSFINFGVTGYCYACLEGFLGFPSVKDDNNPLQTEPLGTGLGSLISALLSGYEPFRSKTCNLPGLLPAMFSSSGVF